MLGYSPISAIDRQIEPCSQYDKYFDMPKLGKLKKKVVDSDGGVEETVQQMLNVVNQNWKEVEKAKHLVKGVNTYDTASKIFDFLYRHIKYNLERGEILNTPSASYYWGQVKARENVTNTKQYPIDCDDFTIFACSFLKSLGLPWGLRIASYDGVRYGHVYCVVPQANGKEIIIDPVYIAFNQEKPYKMQKTFIGSNQGISGMPIYTQGVNGLSGFSGKLKERRIVKKVARLEAKGKTAKVERIVSKMANKPKPIIIQRQIVANKPIVQQRTVIQQRPVIQHRPVIQQRPIVVNKPIVQQRPIVANKPIIQQRPIIQQKQVLVNKPVYVAPVIPPKPVYIAPVVPPYDETETQQYEEPIYESNESFDPQYSEESSESFEPEYSEESNQYEPESEFETDTMEENTEELIEGLLSGVHFSGYGLGSVVNDNQQIKNYLKDTLKVAKRRPDLIRKQHKSPYMFAKMLQTAINGLDTKDEADIFNILAQQERQFMTNAKALSGMDDNEWYLSGDEDQELSGVSYKFVDGERYMNLGNLGFFGRLGLFKKLKQKRIVKLTAKGKTAKVAKIQKRIVKADKRKAKIKSVVQSVAKVLNKVNPVTVAARNGLRILIALNFFGIASKLKADKEAADKTRQMFKNMGGNVEKLNKSIENGAKKKALMKKTGKVKINDSFDGFEGAEAEVSSLVGIAGKIVAKIFEWFKKKVEEKKAKKAGTFIDESVSTEPQLDEMPTLPQEYIQQDAPKKEGLFKKAANFIKTNMNSQSQQNSDGNQSNDTEQNQMITQQSNLPQNTASNNLPIAPESPLKKYGLWIAGIGAVGAIAWFASRKPQTSLTGTGKPKHKKLSGIKLK